MWGVVGAILGLVSLGTACYSLTCCCPEHSKNEKNTDRDRCAVAAGDDGVMTVIEDALSCSEPADRAIALKAIFKARSIARRCCLSFPACTPHEYEKAFHDMCELGRDLNATNINYAHLEYMRHERSRVTTNWSTWARSDNLAMAPKTGANIEKLINEWGAAAAYVMPRHGGDGRFALTYMVSQAIANMVGDKGALTPTVCDLLQAYMLTVWLSGFCSTLCFVHRWWCCR